jgi:hypothetical protein
MGKTVAALTGLSLLAGAASIAHAATGIVLGDSHRIALAGVSHPQNFAHIRGPKAVEQIRQAPAGTTAFVVLGTIDANGATVVAAPAPPASCALAPAPTPAPRLSLRLLLPQLGPECPVDELKVFVLRVKRDHAIGWEN